MIEQLNRANVKGLTDEELLRLLLGECISDSFYLLVKREYERRTPKESVE